MAGKLGELILGVLCWAVLLLACYGAAALLGGWQP